MHKKIIKKIFIFLKKRKFLQLFLILFIFSRIITSLFIQVMLLNDWWINTFWNIRISNTSSNNIKSIDLKYKDTRAVWNIKSWFIDSDFLYSLYYYPINVYLYEKNSSKEIFDYYQKYVKNKEEIKFEELPFYFIYDSETDKYAYLNAKKEIIKWDLDKEFINFKEVKKLDNSNIVNLCIKKCNQAQKLDFNFETSKEDFSNNENEYPQLLIKFNKYLNETIEKY